MKTFTILIHTTYFENSKFERFDRFSNTNVKHEDLGSALDSLMASASSAGHVLGSISITQNP